MLLTLVAAMFFNSCTNLDDVENRLDVLEDEVAQMQDAIKAMEDAYGDGKVILSVEPSQKEEGGWVICFSDGTSIELLNGADGKDGLDGKDGADGRDGVTPYLRVDLDGYWCISYDGGETFTRLMTMRVIT